MVFGLEISGSPLSVGVTFLSILRNIQILSYLNHLLFYFFHHAKSDCNSIHWVTPADWNLELSTIEGFKRAHIQGFLIIIVVGKLYQS
jgi:hypothetical protein